MRSVLALLAALWRRLRPRPYEATSLTIVPGPVSEQEGENTHVVTD